MEERIVKKLMTSIKCSHCGQSYQLRNIKVVGHHQDIWFFNVYCSACHTQYLIAAAVSTDKTEVVNDLTPAEMERFQRARLLTADDLLDMHSFLSRFNGDFARLFKYERV